MGGLPDERCRTEATGRHGRVNFVAHVHVALCLAGSRTDAAGLAFGAALPDLASMAGVRLDRSALPEAVREGVLLHHRTDAVFHSLLEFRTGVRRLSDELKEQGLPVGAARAVGHAGWELLLDGCLLERRGTAQAFADVLAAAPDVARGVAPADPDRWRRLLATMRQDRWWLGYGDTELVARRLQQRLQARRRLAFPVEQVPVVARALSAARPPVDRALDGVMAGVTAALGT